MDGEEEPLLADEEQHGCYETPRPPNPFADLPVYTTIHRVRREIIASIDDPYSLEQLRAPRINVAIVRPLVNRLWDRHDESLIYCLLVNKLQFLREQAYEAHQTINTTRAMLCELAALKILRRVDEETPGREGLLLLSNILVSGFEPFQKAPEDIIRQTSRSVHWTIQKTGGYERKSTVLEVAIISESKILLSSPACQKVMEAIYVGRIVYTPSSFIDIIPDHYKHKPISLYHPKKSLLLNQYRLQVPRTRNLMDIGQFIILLVLYALTMEHRDEDRFTMYELVFSIYAFGWVLDEFASILEHGWHCYTQNLWSFLDTIFALIYVAYFILRVHSLSVSDPRSGEPALNILSAGAPVLIPRLAFNFMSENMLFVSLRAMMADFTVLTFLAVWCFGGFLLSMMWLSDGEQPVIVIAEWMLWVWFGLDGTGIEESPSFHWLIGPILMVTFAFLGNTLFLTILVSMLSSTYAKIASNATAEIQFRRAVLTFEGVKSDAIFAYQPPFNILALFVLLPFKFILSPRWFHKINVTAVRTINAPLLAFISMYERHNLWAAPNRQARGMLAFWDFSRFSVHGDTQAVFELEPPESLMSQVPEIDNATNNLVSENASVKGDTATRPQLKRTNTAKRKDSMAAINGITEHLSEFLHDHSAENLAERLEAVEASTQRIETMLLKISQDMGEDNSESGHGPQDAQAKSYDTFEESQSP
ncbi:hypothetical protein ACLMJK_002539 [Lecanora helva]